MKFTFYNPTERLTTNTACGYQCSASGDNRVVLMGGDGEEDEEAASIIHILLVDLLV